MVVQYADLDIVWMCENGLTDAQIRKKGIGYDRLMRIKSEHKIQPKNQAFYEKLAEEQRKTIISLESEIKNLRDQLVKLTTPIQTAQSEQTVPVEKASQAQNPTKQPKKQRRPRYEFTAN